MERENASVRERDKGGDFNKFLKNKKLLF